ncbi:MAG: hypothetical protein V7776_04900 [Halopseudomonas aestusnigri]
MNDTITDVKEVVKERLHNPIFATFIISWLAFNWDVILYAFLSKQDIAGRISTLRTDYISFSESFIYPFGVAIVVVILIPIINFGIKKAVKYFTLKNTLHDSEVRTEILRGRSEEARAERDYIMKREGVDTINDITLRAQNAERHYGEIVDSLAEVINAKYIKLWEIPKSQLDDGAIKSKKIIRESLSKEDYKTVSNLIDLAIHSLQEVDSERHKLLGDIGNIGLNIGLNIGPSDITVDNSSPENIKLGDVA